MRDHPVHHQLDQLLARLVDGDATECDITRLEEFLDGDSDAQRRYVHYFDLHAELVRKSQQSMLSGSTESRGRESSTLRWILGLVATGLAVALLTAVALRFSENPDEVGDPVIVGDDDDSNASAIVPSDDGVAVLTHAADVLWLNSKAPESGAILSPGELKLSRGVVHVEFYNGAQLLVEGPADLEIVSVDRVIFRQGKLRARVPPHAAGFSVLTPSFELVDLGTEFAVGVTRDGQSDVHVLDGEVVLYKPDGRREASEKQVLYSGDAAAWSQHGTKALMASDPDAFPSFEALLLRGRSASNERFTLWQRWNESLKDDPRIVARYDFDSSHSESNERVLIDTSTAERHGTIVGCEWATGRWPDKRALEFKRPGDRVRIDVPGEFDALTVAAWVRVDALPARHQALVLTDGHQVGHLHWQVRPDGGLRMSSRNPPQSESFAFGHSSPPVFRPRQIGVWNFVCSTYDCTSGMSVHWFNGKQVSGHTVESDLPIRIGPAEIGNWARPTEPVRHLVRNFVGRMDDLTFWRAALQPDEILAIYQSTRP